MQELPWWQTLPEDFNRSAHSTAIDKRHALKIRSTAALDLVLRTALGAAVLGATSRIMRDPAMQDRELELLEFYKGCADRADRHEVFQTPPQGVAVKRLSSPLFGYRPRGIPVELLGFRSPYVALHPEVRDDYARHHRSHKVVAQHWRHESGPRPTLIFIHGYTADAFWLNSAMFSLRWFYKKGYDILLYTLPFHGYRGGRFDLFSGIGYFAHGFAQMNEAMLQSVYDLRIWIDYLQAQGVPAVGVSGLSLGGYISALAASADARLAFAIPNAPVVLPADMFLEWQPTATALRWLLSRRQIGVGELRHALALHCPLTWQPAIAGERLLVIGGAGDRFTSPRYVHALHRHWQGSRMHWFPGNHLVHLHQAEYLRLMRRFMDSCTGLAPGEAARA